MYIPLHHKYRPQTFAQLVGQEVIRTTLSNGVRLGRIAPAYLFTGPRGTGKTSSARILAKALNCQSTDAPTPEPCGVCSLCQAIGRGTALDIIEIDAASHTGVDNVREMIERAQFAPVQARYKVFIIDECHMLSGAAFNALLKTLEEPPERVVFVLATTDPQRVPATIISRCQRFDFRRIAPAEMEAHLRRIAQQEGIEITPAALTLVTQLAGGGMRDAESLLDQLSLLTPPIQPEQVWQLAGRVPERELLELLRSIYTESLVTVLERGRALLERGWEPLQLYQQLVGFVRDGLIALTAPQQRHLTTLMADTWQELQTLGQQVTTADLWQAQDYLRQSEPQIRHTTQPHLWLEVTLLGWWQLSREKNSTGGHAQTPVVMTAPQPSPAPAQPTHPDPHQNKSKSKSNGVNHQGVFAQATPPIPPAPTPKTSVSGSTPAPEAPPASPNQELDRNNLTQLWAEVVAHIKKVPSRSLFQDATLVSLDDQHAEIALKSSALLQAAQGKIKDVQLAFKQVLKKTIQITLIAA
ncbi:MAG: DNA polymerase III subunit gamma/tau, partial [Gloeomargarita sp. DG_2_bins_126]